MRMLTEYELDLVAGGTATSDGDEGTVGIFDPHGGDTGGGFGTGMWFWIGGSPTYTDAYGDIVVSGGHWGFIPGDTQTSNWGSGQAPSTYDHRDCAAQALGDAIHAQSDSHYLEYQGLIYRDANGEIHTTDIGTTGDATHVQLDPSALGVPGGATLIGVVHDHPDEVLQDPNTGATIHVRDDALAALPSYKDLKGMYDYVQNGYASANDYSIYIEYNGHITEYKYADQDWSKLALGDHGQADWGKIATDYDPC